MGMLNGESSGSVLVLLDSSSPRSSSVSSVERNLGAGVSKCQAGGEAYDKPELLDQLVYSELAGSERDQKVTRAAANSARGCSRSCSRCCRRRANRPASNSAVQNNVAAAADHWKIDGADPVGDYKVHASNGNAKANVDVGGKGSDQTEGSDNNKDTVLNTARERIANIRAIERDKELKAAFKEWTRLLKDEKDEVDDTKKERSDLVTQIYNIIGFFSVFQGVVLTAVSQLSSSQSSKCGKIWFPILLSVVAAAVTIVALWIKFSAILTTEHNLNEHRTIRKGLAYRVDQLRKKGKNFEFGTDAPDPDLPSESELKLWLKKIAIFVAPVLFTGIFVLSYFVILCDKWEIGGWN